MQQIYDPRDKFDVAMARRGMYLCPHLSIYCPGPPGKRVKDCQGEEECWRIADHPYLAKSFEPTQAER